MLSGQTRGRLSPHQGALMQASRSARAPKSARQDCMQCSALHPSTAAVEPHIFSPLRVQPTPETRPGRRRSALPEMDISSDEEQGRKEDGKHLRLCWRPDGSKALARRVEFAR